MAFPKNLSEMKPAGYKFESHARCKGCGEQIEWWSTPRGKKIPMNVMETGSHAAVAHWTTCSEAPLFRDEAKKKDLEFR
jgi:hypothetical protein